MLEIKKEQVYSSIIEASVFEHSLNTINKIIPFVGDAPWDAPVKTSHNVSYNILNIDELASLKFHILSHVDNYMRSEENFFEGYIQESWINVYEKNFSQEFHTHTDLLSHYFSGVVYFTDNNTEIEFGTSSLNSRKRHKPQQKEILIFEDSVPHRVLVNNKDNLRISLAFNFKKCSLWKGANFKN